MSKPLLLHAEPVSRVEKIAYGSGDMAINFAYASLMLLITYFYTDIYGLDPLDMGIMFFVVRVVDAAFTPVMGWITDSYSTRWGRYRHYFLLLAIPFGLALFFTFTTPHATYDYKLVWAYLSYGFLSLMFTAITIPYISILGMITKCRKERLSLSGYRMFMAKLAAFSVVILVPIFSGLDYWQGDLQLGYQVIMAVLASIAVLLFFFCFNNVTERNPHPNVGLKFSHQIKLIFTNKPLALLGLSCLLSTMGFMIRGALAIYYARYYLQLDVAGQSLFLGLNVTASISAMVVSTWITKRYSKTKLFYKSQLLAAFLSLLLLAVPETQVLLALLLFFTLSFVVDLHSPVFWASIADAVEYGERRSGHKIVGLSYCLISMSQKLAIGVAGGFLGWALAMLNYDVTTTELSEQTIEGIVLLFALLPAIFHGCVGVVIKRYHQLQRSMA